MIAVTGGGGFLGRELVELLTREGGKLRLLSRTAPESPSLEHRATDLVQASPAELSESLRGVKILYHLAGRVSRDPADGPALMELHVEGLRKLLAAAQSRKVRRVILVSTSGTVGVSRNPDAIATDDSPYAVELASRWPYYASKIYQEKTALGWARENKRELIILRPSLLLGPGDADQSSTGDVVRFLQGKTIFAPAGGLSFVDVRDAALALVRSGSVKIKDLKEEPRTYLLGAANWSFVEFTRVLSRLSGTAAPRVKISPGLARAGAKLLSFAGDRLRARFGASESEAEMSSCYWYIDSSRALAELGITLRSPEETLRDTIQYIRSRP